MKTERVGRGDNNSTDMKPMVSKLDIVGKYRHQSINNQDYIEIFDGDSYFTISKTS